MKRHASEEPGTKNPAKVIREADKNEASSLARADTVVTHSGSPEPTRSRQRKAPAWLSSYVTGGSAKDVAKAAAEIPTKKAAKKKGGNEDSREAKEKTPKTPKGKSINKSELSALKKPDGTLNSKLQTFSSLSTLSPSHSSLSTSSSKTTSNSSLTHSSAITSKPSILQLSESGLSNYDNILEVCEGIDVVTTSTCPPINVKKSAVASSTSMFNEKQASSRTLESKNKTVAKQKSENSSTKVKKVTKLESNSTANNEDGSFPLPGKGEAPTMLEVVICVSTSGAMRDYLVELQANAREVVWRLQSLIPDLRIGVFAHTQGGIHDDKRAGASCSVANIDHNYIRTGGHSGTKWLDLGASFSQICAFISSLEPETVVYPDYVQDNLEMALWKLQRCMSWSSCSYRTVLMLGRGRPNSTTFYLQREHWRGWIRSALELGPRQEVPVIDWRLEARLLAQMGIHVFTLQAVTEKTVPDDEEEEEEGTIFFQETAASTNGQHFRLTDASRLGDIIVGVCCACYGPDLLQEHRDELRDQNDGVVPAKLKDIFVSLGLHSNRRSLKTIPSLVGDLQALQNKIKAADMSNGRLMSTSEEEGGMSSEGEDITVTKKADVKIKTESSAGLKGNPKAVTKPKKEKKEAQSGAGKTKVEKGTGKANVEKCLKNGKVEKKSSKVIESKRVANVLKKINPEKLEGVISKSVPNKTSKKTAILKANNSNDKAESLQKSQKKIGRPSSAAKTLPKANQSVTPTKAVTNSTRAKKLNTGNKVAGKAISTLHNKDAKKQKVPRGRPKGNQRPVFQAKDLAKNEKNLERISSAVVKKTGTGMSEKTPTLVKRGQANNKKAKPLDSVASGNKKLVNGKQPTKNNKLIKGKEAASKNLRHTNQAKGAVAVTRGSLKNRK